MTKRCSAPSLRSRRPPRTPSIPPDDAEARGDPESGDTADGVVVYRPGMTMEEMEREAIVAALRAVEGNRRKAAELLGIGERTLYRKIRRFEIDL